MPGLQDAVNGQPIPQKGTNGAAHVIDQSTPLSPQNQAPGGTIALSGSSQQTAAIAATTVDVQADTACFIAIGSNPTAALNTSYRIPANTPIRVGLTTGSKIAVIGTTGNFWYHPVVSLA